MLLALGAAHRAKAILPALENRGLRTGKQGLQGAGFEVEGPGSGFTVEGFIFLGFRERLWH